MFPLPCCATSAAVGLLPPIMAIRFFCNFGSNQNQNQILMCIRTHFPLLMIVLSLCLYSCGGGSNSAQETAEQAAEEASSGGSSAAESVEGAMEEMKKQMQGDGEAKEVTDFRELKKLLPEELAGLERSSHTGQKTGAMGFKIAAAEAVYEGENGRLEVVLTDFAGMGRAMLSMVPWAEIEIDKETDTGYERTTMIKGYKAFEEYDSQAKRGKISIIADGRFVVAIEGDNVEAKVMRDALDGIDLEALSAM